MLPCLFASGYFKHTLGATVGILIPQLRPKICSLLIRLLCLIPCIKGLNNNNNNNNNNNKMEYNEVQSTETRADEPIS